MANLDQVDEVPSRLLGKQVQIGCLEGAEVHRNWLPGALKLHVDETELVHSFHRPVALHPLKAPETSTHHDTRQSIDKFKV